MPDLNLRVHKKFHSPQTGARAKIHILEVEVVSFIHSSQLTIHIQLHQPEHGGDPIGVDQAVRTRIRQEGRMTREPTTYDLQRGGQGPE